MSDVFVSYKAEDRRRVQPLVDALAADGLSVWWDAQIGGGDDWRDTIQQQLDGARCVIVCWSRRSVGPEGRFVRDEATRAQRRGAYLPVRIDTVEPPLGFGEVQALPLTGWKGDRADPRYQAVLAAARGRLGHETVTPAPAIAAAPRIGRRLVLAGGGVALAGAAGTGGWWLWRGSGGDAAEQSIAVMPFANLSGDPAQAYFSEGIAEELRSALTRIARLKVVGRTSSEAVREETATRAARQLGVGNVLTGSVRRSPAMVRISAQLVGGGDGLERWSQTYDRAPGDALQIQTDIAENVARALSIELGRAERAALTIGGTSNPAAQDLFLKAREQLRADDSEASKRRALALDEAAIALDPNFAEAHAAKARTIIAVAHAYGTNRAENEKAYAQAEAAARRAVALAPRLASAYLALAAVADARFDFAGALAFYQRARSFAPGDAAMLRLYGQYLGFIGDSDKALTLADRAITLDPLNPSGVGVRALILFYARRYAEAIATARRSLQLAPKRAIPRLWIGGSLIQLGRLPEARAEYARIPVENHSRHVGEAIVAARLGDRAGSDRSLAMVRQTQGDAANYQYAQIYAQRGETDQAFAALDRAWAFRDPGLISLRKDPFLDPLRGDPRFAGIEKRLNFP